MKLDKEALLKHKFWVLLAVSLPITLLAIFVLMTAVRADIASTKKKLDDELKLLDAKGALKNPKDVDEAKERADLEKAKEKIVWANAYKEQAFLYQWPKAVEDTFNFRDGFFANEIKGIAKPPVGEAAPAAPEEPAKEEDRIAHGTVKQVTKDFIIVGGNDKKDYKFYRTQGVKVSFSDEESIKFFFDIPQGAKVTVTYDIGKYFNDPFTDSEQSVYTRFGVYHSQLDAILRQVEPMNDKGEGVVQLKGWFYEKGKLPGDRTKFLNYLPKEWDQAEGDISEEAWLAQEDLWIQHEIYRLIRLANDYVSELDEVKGQKNIFKNAYWEMAVAWPPAGDKLQIKLKNLLPRRQRLDMHFFMKFHKTMDPEKVLVGGEPLDPKGTPGAERDIFVNLKPNALRTGIYGVRQMLTWETAAVKRIDQITIGMGDEGGLDHRNFPSFVQPLKKEEKKEVADDKDKMKPQMGFNKNMGGGAAQQVTLTKHGLMKERYLEVTPQARRLPVAVALIVDQDHVDRVQTAFANSKLRFLTTQVLLNRYPSSLRPPLLAQGGAVGDGGKKGMFMPMMPMGPPDGVFKGGFPFGGGAGNPAPVSSGDEMETNVEIVLYGVVTLYERFPPPNRPAVAAN